ncbi:hypothetical protein HPB47_021909 [Ixodes persulcatus]|uniref:Uncharacterized protein n=1 Tax=Ixodes persulcatus TaxID=34615 RepID=A0AC60QBJ8_IXOPE|nr:hypothetical protein HPB47_021909 [Ixodes persulcatus]
MKHFLKLHEEGKDLDRLLCNLKLQVFNRPAGYKFMEEYCNVMKPLSCALDVLQKKEHMFIGYLLPALAILEKRVKFKLSWIEDGSRRDQASNYLKTELASVTSAAMADVAVSTPENVLSLGQQTLQPEAQDELSRYLPVLVNHPQSQMKRLEG